MRLDKFLQISRLIKKRELAKKACEGNKVLLDGQRVKPGKEVKIGQIITIIFPERTMDVEILEIPKGNVSKARAREIYRDLGESF